mmetsp:Transcript_22288/g.34486  ORF Transcript_22288/g.34486 Transcript_22288/m.34486 type:complete len:222 (+) Transcript_22288:952-1617(+)
MRAISTHNVNLRDSLLQERIKNLVAVEAASRRAQEGASQLVDVGNMLGLEFKPVLICFRIESLVSPLDSIDFFDLVAEPQRHHNLADHHVQAGAEASARDDGRLDLVGVEENLFARATLAELERSRDVLDGLVISGGDNESVVGHEAIYRDELAASENSFLEIVSQQRALVHDRRVLPVELHDVQQVGRDVYDRLGLEDQVRVYSGLSSAQLLEALGFAFE